MTEKLKRALLVVGAIASLTVTVLGYGVFRMLFGPPILRHTCEVVVTDNVILRIQAFLCDSCGNPCYYQVSHDNGKNWTTFHTYINNDMPTIASCDEFQIVTTHKVYFVPTYSLDFIITNDAGTTWHEWSPYDIEPYPVGFSCFSIADVGFQDEALGNMVLECNHYNDTGELLQNQNINLLTTDGGETWEINRQ